MITVYPDFAFSTITQIVLFFINVLVTTLSYLWGANIILLIYQKKVTFGQKLLYGVISAFFLHLIIAYGIAFLNGVVIHHLGRLSIGVFQNVTKIMNPFSYLIMYLLGRHLLKLSKYQSMHIMRLLYVYSICCFFLLKISGKFIFPNIPDPRGWNYLRDILTLISGTILTYILYQIVTHFTKKYKLHLEFPDNLVIADTRRELLKNFALSSIVYGIVMIFLYFPTTKGYEYLYLFLLLLGYLVINLLTEYIKVFQTQLGNKDAHIAVLTDSIGEFDGIKHDFNNILLTYSGYLDIEDYGNLKQYHKTVINTIVSSETNLSISQRMPEHPAFFALINAKLKLAQKKNIRFQFDVACSMEQLQMDALDFCRILGILIDNAIEEAEKTTIRHVEFVGQQKPNGDRLLILSNDTATAVNTEQIFISGYTTKPNHMGQGMTQVREILHRYGNCTLNITYYQKRFTAYFEIKAKTS